MKRYTYQLDEDGRVEWMTAHNGEWVRYEDAHTIDTIARQIERERDEAQAQLSAERRSHANTLRECASLRRQLTKEKISAIAAAFPDPTKEKE